MNSRTFEQPNYEVAKCAALRRGYWLSRCENIGRREVGVGQLDRPAEGEGVAGSADDFVEMGAAVAIA